MTVFNSMPDTPPARRSPSRMLASASAARVLAADAPLEVFTLPPVASIPVDDPADPEVAAAERALRAAFERGVREGVQAERERLQAEFAAERAALAAERADAVEAAAAASAAAESLLRASAALDAREEELVHIAEDRLVATAVALAEDLVGRHLAMLDDCGVTALARAAALVPERGELVLRFHPDDAASARDALEDLASTPAAVRELLNGRAWSVAADDSVARRGAVVDCGPARIDAQWDSAFGRIRAHLGL